MNLLHDVPLGEKAPEAFYAVIEIPKGSTNKYEIDKKTGLIKLDRVSYTSQFYPFDYGFAPQTWWHYDDPLDVILLTTYPLFPGILAEVRPVGAALMTDSGDQDDKIIAVPMKDPHFETLKDISDVSEHTKKEIKHFFETYKLLQNKIVEVTAFEDRKKALAIVKESQALYRKKFSR